MQEFMERVPRLHADVGIQRVGGRLMAAGPGDELHTFEGSDGAVSEVGERILELCDGTRTVGRIVDALCAEFAVERSVAEEDAVAFVKLLLSKRVVELG